MALPKSHLLILEDRYAVCGLIESSEALDSENGICHVPVLDIGVHIILSHNTASGRHIPRLSFIEIWRRRTRKLMTKRSKCKDANAFVDIRSNVHDDVSHNGHCL